MWTVNADDIKSLRTPGGDKFTEVVNALICAQAHVCGIPLSEIGTNLSTTTPDGGVDTEVLAPVENDPTGWLREYRTIWQFKARQSKDIRPKSLEKEIQNGKHVQERIRQGYAYRLCVCDNVGHNKRNQWQALLNREIRKINPDAPDSKVLSADDLAQWANHFPVIVARVRPSLATICRHLEAWRRSITNETPEFVPVAAWSDIQERIAQQVNFAISTPEIIMPISGVAGVGKTRLVYESLASLAGAQYLVVYTDNGDHAFQLANLLANDSFAHAILVVDECDVDQRVDLKRKLRGIESRVRVITIDNSGERPMGSAQELWVERITVSTLEDILIRNFPNVPPERRRAYASSSGGFVLLAARLCQDNTLIEQTGRSGNVMLEISDYLRRRLKENLSVLLALSLVTKVGRSGSVEGQLKDLCQLTELDPREVNNIANSLHNHTGFVGRSSLFFYVTPDKVADIAFDMAWNRWAEEDPSGFLSRIPSSLIDVFNRRVATVPNEEVRRIVGDFFRRWANSLKPAQLASEADVDQLNTLIEIKPQNYLPVLRRLVEEATRDELLAITDRGSNGRWGPRRLLVWAAERLAAFPEYFDDAEAVLLRLALAESESHVSNNATGIWQQFFRIRLSGTSVPFIERLVRLKERLFSQDSAVSSLALEALRGIFNPFVTRGVGPIVVAGRIAPEEWEPTSWREEKQCLNNAVALMQKAVLDNSLSLDLKEKALSIAISYIRILLSLRYLEEMQNLFSQASLSNDAHIRLIKGVEEFLFFEGGKYNGQRSAPEDYLSEVSIWLDSLRPGGFHGKLVSLIGAERWHHSMLKDEDQWREEVHSLAIECLEKRDEFIKEIEWIHSSQAQSSSILGEEIGRLDEEAQLLPLVFEAAVRFKSVEFARGYINQLLFSHPQHAGQVNAEIDKIQKASPELAYELFTAGGDHTCSLQRAIDLVEAGKLDIVYLKRFVNGVWPRQLSLDELEMVLKLLINAAESGDKVASEAAIEFIAFRLIEDKRSESESVLTQDRIRSLAWILMEITAKDSGRETYYWPHIFNRLVEYDPERAIRILVSGIISDNFAHRDACKNILGQLAQKYPDMVMNQVGDLILDPNLGQRFCWGDYRGLIHSLPEDMVINWIRANGVEAARRIASQLYKPRVDKGEMILSPLTKFILEEFEDDDKVFSAFCCGQSEFFVGSLAPHYEAKAAIAEKFLNYPLRRIREWAEQEVFSSRHTAERWRQREEEEEIEFR